MIIDELLNFQVLIGAVIVGVAGLMRGFTGTGSALITAPLFSLLFGPQAAIGMVALLEIGIAIQLMPAAVHLTPWRVIAPMTIVGTLFVPFGAWALIIVDAEIMKRTIALVVLVSSLVLLSGYQYPGQPTARNSVPIGTLSGLLNGATAMGGPPVTLYILAAPWKMEVARAALISHACLIMVPTFISLTVGGVVTWSIIGRALLLLPIYVITTWIGSRAFRTANESAFRKAALRLLVLVAVATLVA
tara:strand:+ start:2008 stop:2745 length:738 start_codon:yes stop_codon:yes gene_type:complete